MRSRNVRHLRLAYTADSAVRLDVVRLGPRSAALAQEQTICPVLAAFAAPLLDAGIGIDLEAFRGTRATFPTERARAAALAAWSARTLLGLPPDLTLAAYFSAASERDDALAESVREVLSLAIAGGTECVGAGVGEIFAALVAAA